MARPDSLPGRDQAAERPGNVLAIAFRRRRPRYFTIDRAGAVSGRSRLNAIGSILMGASMFAASFTHPDHAMWTPNWLCAPGQITHPPNPSYELEAFDPARVAYSPGRLALSIREDPVTVAGTTYPYRSAAIRWFYDGTPVGKVTENITSSPMFPVFSYSVTDPGSARCVQYPDACGGAIDPSAVMQVRDFTVRP